MRTKLQLGVATLLLLAVAGAAHAQPTELLDRVVAVVNRHAILASEIDDEIRLSVLDPMQQGQEQLTPRRALEQLVSRWLIEQQIRSEEGRASDPSRAEVEARLSEIRRELPFCVHRNCVADEGWKQVLAERGLTPERVAIYLRYRLQILAFIELRFRQGIRIAPEEVSEYYNKVLVPQYKPGEPMPPLPSVSARIEEILLEQRVSQLFEDWLGNLRRQGDVEVLDPALESATADAAGKGATR